MTVTASVGAPADTRQSRRAARFDARYALWSLSSLKRVRSCGRFAASKDGVPVKASGSSADGSRVAGFSGVQSCGSVWSCPVCSANIQATRQQEVKAALQLARARGWEVVFLTLTVRHQASDSLRYVWEQVGKGWRAATSGSRKAWSEDVAGYGVAGYLRLLEVTHGDNGWHVHVHALLFLDPAAASKGRLSDADVQALGVSMFLRFRKAVGSKLVPSFRRGLDVKRVRDDELMDSYFAKQVFTRKGESSTAHDVTGGHSKLTKRGNRTPFGIVADLLDVATGEMGADYDRDLELWHTFEKVSRGKRQLLWSNGLRDELSLAMDERSDQEIVEAGHDGEEVAVIPSNVYRAVAARRELIPLLLAVEHDDTGEALASFLARIELHRRT